MRTTVRLDEQLLSQAKKLAQNTGRTLTAVISDSVREAVARSRKAPKRVATRLPTFKGDGLMPGVHIDHGFALRDLMDTDAAF